MDSVSGILRVWMDELGPAWMTAIVVLLSSSILLKTWLLLAFTSGVLLTLYLHSYNLPERQRIDVQQLFKSAEGQTVVLEEKDSDGTLPQTIPSTLRTEMQSLSDYIIANYIRWWYQPPNFAADDRFPLECQKSLNRCLGRMYHFYYRKDPIFYFDTIFINFVATSGAVLDELRVSYKARTEHDKLGLQQFRSDRPDAIITRMMSAQERTDNLHRLANAFVSKYADTSDLACRPVREFLEQLLASSIFEKTLQSLGHRDTINQSFVTALSSKTVLPSSDTKSRDHLVAALDLATKQAASVTQEIQGSCDTEMINEYAVTVDEDCVPAQPIEAQAIVKPPRGRRLSFKNKSVSSIAEFYDEDGNRVVDRRMSFLRRTGSLLSRSRSRSTSPSKSVDLSDQIGHARSRSLSPAKKILSYEDRSDGFLASSGPAKVNLFQAEIIVSDASDINSNEYKKLVKVMPKFSILISPLKQEESLSGTGGIGIFRSMRDVQELDRVLRMKTGASVPVLPAWQKLTYAELESELLAYLSKITRDRSLSDSEAFARFCRPDLISHDNTESSSTLTDLKDSSTTMLNSTRLQKEHVSTDVVASKIDPVKRVDTDDKFDLPAGSRALLETRAETYPIDDRTVANHKNGLLKETDQANRLDLSRLDLQNLLSQSMELLTTFYALSPRTWTIRKQLLNVLRNLLLSKNSIYTQASMDYLEHSVLHPFSSANRMAEQLRDFNAFMFPASYTPTRALSPEESQALAIEARTLFTTKAMPTAIRNLMGATPTSEALGILFDALQEPDFSLGFVSILFTETLKTLLA